MAIRSVLLCALAAVSAVTAVIHFAVAGEHFAEYWVFGVFMLGVAWLQIIWAIGLFRWRSRSAAARAWLGLGVALDAIVIVVYVLTRTVGDVIGPTPSDVEPVGFGDGFCTVCEAVAVVIAAVLIRRELEATVPRRWAAGVVATVVAAAVVLLSIALVAGGPDMVMTGGDMGGGTGSAGMSAATMGGGGMSMSMPLLPRWLVWVWVAALAVVVALHVAHAWSMHGRPRLWHLTHIVMAGGMIVMYAVPQPGHARLYWSGVGLFGVLAVLLAVAGWRWWHRERLLNWLWAASTVDMAVMAYMALPVVWRDATVSYLAVAYLIAELVIWLSDPLPRLRRLLAAPQPPPRVETPAPAAPAGGTATLIRPIRHGASAAECESMRLTADVTVGVRVTLAVMSASMVWMLLAMQAMPATMGGMG